MNCRIAIRSATAEDAPFLAWVMLIAARSHRPYGLWDHLLDVPFSERLDILSTFAVTAKYHAGNYRAFRIAEVDGEPAAAVAAYDAWMVDPDDNTDALLETLARHRWTEDRIGALLSRAEVWTSLQLPELDSAWVLEWVATTPSFRRRGVAEYLLMNTLASGNVMGFGRAEVRVAIGNEAAEAVYTRLGFEPVSEHVSAQFYRSFGTPGVRRYVRSSVSVSRPTASTARQRVCSG